MTMPLRVGAAVLVTTATVLVLVLAPGHLTAASAAFGPLRSPGDAAFIAAHRGDRDDAPENTIPAFQAAVAGGADFLETDVRLTADGIPVIMHDETVSRTTDGMGAVADLTLAELRRLDAGSWYDARFAGVRVPLFEEFLDLLVQSPGVGAIIELKDAWTTDETHLLLDGVYARGLQDRVVFASFSPRSLASLREAAPGIPRVLIRRMLPLEPTAVAQRYGVVAILTRPAALDHAPDALDELHAAGIGVLVYTLNTRARWDDAVERGVDGIVTDTPAALDTWIATAGAG